MAMILESLQIKTGRESLVLNLEANTHLKTWGRTDGLNWWREKVRYKYNGKK